MIKWNPAIKTENDRSGLLRALLDDRIDIIASDHGSAYIRRKAEFIFSGTIRCTNGSAFAYSNDRTLLPRINISLVKIVEKMCHNVAELYNIDKRGYIREGYWADLAIVDLNSPWKVTKENIFSKCGWSPLEDQLFHSKVTHTLVNGNVIYENGRFHEEIKGQPLAFYKLP